MSPKPSQLTVPSSRNRASPTAAPRVARSASWQRSVTDTRSSHGSCRKLATAAAAASLAGDPWPTPSIAATSAAWSSASTSASSPDCSSPGIGRPATHHSTMPARSGTVHGAVAQSLELVALAPLAHRDRGPAPELGLDRELVHESLRSGKPEAESVAGRVALAQRAFDVADARPAVARDDLDAKPAVLGGPRDRHLARAGMHEDVAADLGDRGGDQRRVRTREPKPPRERAPFAARSHDVGVPAELHPDVARPR